MANGARHDPERIHAKPERPNLRWHDVRLLPLLAEIRHRQGRLLGRMEWLGFRLRAKAILTTLTSEVIQSSAIEGERLDAAQVRSSIARRLGLDFFRRRSWSSPLHAQTGGEK